MVTLRMNQAHFDELHAHLFPGDGLESVAFAICGRRAGIEKHILLVHDIVIIPYSQCIERRSDFVSWSPAVLKNNLLRAAKCGQAIVKFHCHPGGFPKSFSELDDRSDQDLFSSIYGWMDTDEPHASVIMLPNGEMIGRAVMSDGEFQPISRIAVIGDDIRHYDFPDFQDQLPNFTRRNEQVFGKGTTRLLSGLSAAVVGCSGTGGPVVEQLQRLGIGHLVLVDDEVVEEINLNRIPYARLTDAQKRTPKVDVLARAIEETGLGTEVTALRSNLISPETVRIVAECDVVFGCMDGAEGRETLNRLSTFYILPYFDAGVRIEVDPTGEIGHIGGVVRYIQPGRSSLFSRGVFTLEEVAAESLRRTDPEAYRNQVRRRYLHGVDEDRPAVTALNTLISSFAVMEFLARVHPFRFDSNAHYADLRICLTDPRIYCKEEGAPCPLLLNHIGRGDVTPPLERSSLS